MLTRPPVVFTRRVHPSFPVMCPRRVHPSHYSEVCQIALGGQAVTTISPKLFDGLFYNSLVGLREFRQFAFVSAKGGVGKTTLLAAFARRLSGRVALLDLDFSNPVLNIALGLDHYRVQEIKGGRFLPLAWEKGEIMSLAFFTAPGGILRQPNSDYRTAFIQDLLPRIAWQPYDWLLIDTAPSISQENEAILQDLDPESIVIAGPGPLAEEGTIRTLLFLQALKVKLLGVIGNRGFDPGSLAEELGVASLGSIPEGLPARVPDFTQHKSIRLGQPSWADRLRRSATKLGLRALLEVSE